MINAEITVAFKASNLITQADLDDWDGEGNGITLKEYVRLMVEKENMLLDIVDDYAEIKVVSVKAT